MSKRLEIVFGCNEFSLEISHDFKPISINGVDKYYTLQELKPKGKPPYLKLTTQGKTPRHGVFYKFYDYVINTSVNDERIAENIPVIVKKIATIHAQNACVSSTYTDFVACNSSEFVPVVFIDNIHYDGTQYADRSWSAHEKYGFLKERSYIYEMAARCDLEFEITKCIDPELDKLLPSIMEYKKEYIGKLHNLFSVTT